MLASHRQLVVCPGVSHEEFGSELLLVEGTALDPSDGLQIRPYGPLDILAVHIVLFLGTVDDDDVSLLVGIVSSDDHDDAHLGDVGMCIAEFLDCSLNEVIFGTRNGAGDVIFSYSLRRLFGCILGNEFLRHLALGYTKDQIAGLRGMPFGVKSLEKRQMELTQKLFPGGNGKQSVNAVRLVTRAFQLHILDPENLFADEE